MSTWGGKRKNCGRKKNGELPKDPRSEELKARMKKNTEINDKHFASQPKGKVKPRFGHTYYEGGF